ncbi:MAG: aminoglycoside phosphotransferase family protein [Anaerolineales bacterium]|nr:aminoglycoside phosphotransferase family protein [Anaerolineales bacterium]
MLEKPAIADTEIVACVQDAFHLRVRRIAFLPLGADGNTAVYQLTSQDEKPYFLKLRSGAFEEVSVTLPHFLHEQGIQELIAPHLTKNGALWANAGDYKMMLYPFIDGHDAYDVPLTDAQWRQFGAALKKVHTAVLPSSLAAAIPTETYTPQFRELVQEFMQQIQERPFTEPVAQKLAAFLNEKRDVVVQLVQYTEALAQTVKERPLPNLLCHSDIHAWNLLISQGGALYMVDWDAPILAPKERDLMFIGAGLGGIWHTPREQTLFYEGYGRTEVDRDVLAYYRCERIIQDIAAYCEQIFLSDEGGADREEAWQNVVSNFLPGSTLDKALAT